MKSPIKNLILSGLTAFALLGGAVQGYSQANINIGVDTNQVWIGYMNVFELPASPAPGAVGAYVFGNPWATVDLDAAVVGTNVIITPNTSISRDVALTNAFWWVADSINPGMTNGNKTMDALYYVQNDALNVNNQTITFSGTCLSNNMIFPYQTVAFIKELAPNYGSSVQWSSDPLTPGSTFTVIGFPDGVAGSHIQYGFETIGPDANTNSVSGHPASYYGQVVIQPQAGDPSVKPLASQLAVETQKSVTFAVTEIGTSPFTNQWYQITADGSTTNTLSDGTKYSGATSTSLTISNIVVADAGTYFCNITNSKGSTSVSAALAVVPLSTAETNYLIDPSFEDGSTWAPASTAGWVNFNGSAFQNVNSVYYNTTTPISVYDGTNCVQLYAAGQYNGVYQDRPASPGQIFTAYSHVYSSSLDPLSGANGYYMELIFLDAGGNRLADWQSTQLNTNNLVTDTWLTVAPGTNYTSGGTATYFTAPANTTTVRAQGTYYCPNYEPGSVYIDSFVLQLRSPIVTAALNGSTINLSFSTIVGPSYNVYYRSSLSSGSWTLLTSTPGDGTVKTVPDALGATPRFYYVQTTQ
jgi:hypothetical protein